jgi:hypothetical protein
MTLLVPDCLADICREGIGEPNGFRRRRRSRGWAATRGIAAITGVTLT